MYKGYAKYMMVGKKVESVYTAETFQLVENMDPETGEVNAVNVKDYRRWQLLKAWLQNGVAKRENKETECKAEAESYVVTLKHNAIKPADKVRFISPDYDTLFEVTDLENVKVDGKVRKVTFLDDYHFAFVDGSGCFHIHEYAEICKNNGTVVEPVKGLEV